MLITDKLIDKRQLQQRHQHVQHRCASDLLRTIVKRAADLQQHESPLRNEVSVRELSQMAMIGLQKSCHYLQL